MADLQPFDKITPGPFLGSVLSGFSPAPPMTVDASMDQGALDDDITSAVCQTLQPKLKASIFLM